MRSDNNTQSAGECIRMVCKHYTVRFANVPSVCDTAGIIEVLRTLDFHAADFHMSMRGLADCPKPVIVQTVTGFMTVLDASKISVKITYGDSEIHRIAFMDFIKVWTGVVIVIEPPPMRKWSFFRKIFS